jgi:hypothetical protein
MKNFTIDPVFLTSVTIYTDHTLHLPGQERMILKLKGHGYSSIRSEDHPEFAKLREQLGKDGWISIQRGWWNGDSVIKPFTLNGKKFKKGAQFPSSAAIRHTLEQK